MRRIVTVELACEYVFDDERYPMDEYDEDDIEDIAYQWFTECTPDFDIKTVNDD